MKKKYALLIVFLIVTSVVLSAVYYYNSITRNTIEKLMVDNKMINILVAGSNSYRNNRHSFFMIVSVNPDNAAIGLTFIPSSFQIAMDDSRNTVRRISDIDFSDFNHIRKSLAADLKLDIPFYVEIYSPDVERCVDLIGGINIYVLDQVQEGPYFNPGENYLDGKKSVKYINSAKMNSIFIKYDRISDLIMTLFSKKTRLLDTSGFSIITEMLRSVKSNLLPQEVLTLAALARKSKTLKSTIAPGSMKGDKYLVDDISFKIYENDFYKSLIIDSEPDAPLQVKLLNGTSTPGLAARIRNNLIRDGLQVSEFGTYTKGSVPGSLLINRKGNYRDVETISEISGVGNIYHVVDSRKLNNALIIIGDDTPR